MEGLETMEGVLKEGDKVKVKLLDVDPVQGKFKLSRKVLLPKPEGYKEREQGPREQGNREQGGQRSHGGPRHQPAGQSRITRKLPAEQT